MDYHKYITTSYFSPMTNQFDPKLKVEFDDSDHEQSILEWIEKAELICWLCMMKRIEFVIPMHLMGSAYTLYQQL